jgi:hypothetical protein
VRPFVLGEVAVVLLLVGVYDRIRDMSATRADLAFSYAHRLLDVESKLHLTLERGLNPWLAQHADLQWLASWYYQLAHLSVTLAVLVWVYVRRPQAYRAARNALVVVNGLALLVFWLMPVAPPRMLPGFIDSGMVTRVSEHATHISADQYAAMPSLHVGWATWVLVQVWLTTTSRTGRALVAVHFGLTVLVVLATGNHYFLDVVAGGVVGAVATRWSRVTVTTTDRAMAYAD